MVQLQQPDSIIMTTWLERELYSSQKYFTTIDDIGLESHLRIEMFLWFLTAGKIKYNGSIVVETFSDFIVRRRTLKRKWDSHDNHQGDNDNAKIDEHNDNDKEEIKDNFE